MYLENINNQHSTHLDNLDCTQWSKTLVLSTSLPSRFVTTLKATSFIIHTVTIIVVFIVMYNHLHGCIINYWFLYMIRTVQDFYKQNAVFIKPFMNSLIVRYIFSAVTFVISIIRKHSFICYCPCGYKEN